ncbi:MAG: hypothetical protein KBG11_10855 [Bacteroidia bacterium]|nr:hypothetical protein [Bacteroidia bacterium]
MKKILLALCCTICALNGVFAQGINGVIGAEAGMLGGVNSLLSSAFSVVNNPAAITDLKKWQTGVYGEKRFGQKELGTTNFSVAVPNKWVDFGAAVNIYGFDKFSQQRFIVAASKKLAETFALGVQINYLNTTINEYGNAGAWVLGAGVIYQPIKTIKVAFMVFNPNQQQLSNKVSDKVPTYARFGVKYTVNDKVDVLAEAEQALEQKTIFRAGLKYNINKHVGFAVGASSQPILFSFGATFNTHKVGVDIAAQVHQVLGVIPQFSLRLPIAN